MERKTSTLLRRIARLNVCDRLDKYIIPFQVKVKHILVHKTVQWAIKRTEIRDLSNNAIEVTCNDSSRLNHRIVVKRIVLRA